MKLYETVRTLVLIYSTIKLIYAWLDLKNVSFIGIVCIILNVLNFDDCVPFWIFQVFLTIRIWKRHIDTYNFIFIIFRFTGQMCYPLSRNQIHKKRTFLRLLTCKRKNYWINNYRFRRQKCFSNSQKLKRAAMKGNLKCLCSITLIISTPTAPFSVRRHLKKFKMKKKLIV